MNPYFAALPLWADLLLTALLVVGAASALIGSRGRRGLQAPSGGGPTKTVTLGVGCVSSRRRCGSCCAARTACTNR